MRIAHLSDPHFGAHDPQVVEAVASTLRRLRVQAVIVSGDFTMSGRRWEYRLARDWLKGLPGPTLIIPGNHDIPKVNQLVDRFFDPLRRYRHYLSPETDPRLELPEGLALGFNSSRPFGWYLDWSRGRLGAAQLDRLRTGYREVSAGGLRIAVFHHPTIALPKNRRALVAPLPEIKQALSDGRVDVVLGGHFHQSYLMELPGMENTPWQTVVSQVSTVTSTRLQGEPQGFHILENSGDELAGEQHTWDGGSFVLTQTLRFRRDERTGWSRIVAA